MKDNGSKPGKRIKRVVLYTLLTLLFLPIAVTLIMQIPPVQTRATHMFLQWVSKKTDYPVTVEKLSFSFFSGIQLENVLLSTPQKDTILAAGTISVSPSFSKLLAKKIELKNVDITNADFRLIWQKGRDNYDFMNFINSFNSDDTISPGKSKPFRMSIKKLNIQNIRFSYVVEGEKPMEDALFNPSDIRIDGGVIKAHNFIMVDDSLHFNLDLLRGKEKSGLTINKMTGTVTISPHELSFTQTSLATKSSNLKFDYAMHTRSWEDYSYFYDSVTLYAAVRPSILEVSDIGYFSTGLLPMKEKIIVAGRLSGPLSHMQTDSLNLKFGKKTALQVRGEVTGLPDFYTSQMNVDIQNLTTSSNDLRNIILPSGKIKGLDFIPDNQPISLTGSFKGTYNDFVTGLRLKHKSNNLELNLEMIRANEDSRLTGTVKSGSLNPGYYLKMPETLGKTIFSLNIDALFKNDFNDVVFNIKGSVPMARILETDLNNIKLESRYNGDTLTTDFSIGDKALLAVANGFIIFDSVPALNYTIHLKKADFRQLNLTSERNTRLSSDINIVLHNFDPDRMTGFLDMTNTKLSFGDEWYRLKEISLNKSIAGNGEHSLVLHSDFVDMDLTGQYTLSTLPVYLNRWYKHYFETDLPEQTRPDGYASLHLLLKDPSIINEQFVSGLEIAPGTELNAKLEFSNNKLSANAQSKQIIFAGTDFKDLTFDATPVSSGINTELTSQTVIIKDSTSEDTTVFGLDNFRITAGIYPDSLRYYIGWKNNDSVRKNYADIEGILTGNEFRRRMAIRKSEVYVNDTLWTISPDNYIVTDSTGTTIHKLNIYRGYSAIAISGKIPRNEKDTLTVVFKQWDLSNFDPVYRIRNFDLDGIVDGDFSYNSGKHRFWFVSDLKIKDLTLNKVLLGDARILNTWDNVNNSVFFKSQIVRKGNSGVGKVFTLDGFLFPFSEDHNFDLKASFNRIKIKAFEPFISEYVTELEGKTEGNITLEGTFGEPVLRGEMGFNRTALRINYLNTKYSFTNRIVFDKNRIDFGKLILYDTLGNHATLTGGLIHDYFKDFRFDLTVHTDKFLFFDTDRNQNDMYYGQAIASGEIYIRGTPDDISMSIKAKSADGTSVTIPLDYTTEILDKDYIVFVPPEKDSLESDTMTMKRVTNKDSRYDITLDMQVQPNADVRILLPYEMGDIKSKGNGNLRLQTNSDGDFSLVGDYVVKSGEFNFNIQNLISKRFILLEGGKISWSGDPYTANMNISGLYTVKTNFSSLGIVVDSSASYKNRLKVYCYVKLTGSLAEPDMRFEIKFPDLDPDMQRLVYAQLDTTNQALVNQQMISLLVLGSFSFSNASNVSLSSSYYSIITNQLSGLLSQFSKDVDIGINYKPGDNISQEEFEVALSTQFFDNRLIINGNFGMTYDRSNKSASNIVGDVDVNFKLTRDGRWILKAFNHSNVNSWYYYNNYDKVSPYTQGVGIAYQKDFNSLSELFENTRKRKNKRNSDKRNLK